MEEIKAPKKERKFLKAIGNIGKVLAEELVMGIARKFIGKVVDKVKFPKKRETLSLFLLLSFTIAFAQFPSTGNKQRLGYQTTADGLVWRGSLSDTASIQPLSNQNAWVILDTVNLKIYSFDFSSNVWNQVGSGAFAQPIDSLFFNVNVPTNNVDTAKMRWDSDLATVVLGLNDNVPNELGFKNFWLVKNQTGSTITKGSLVYANGTVGASGRVTVAKFIANGTIDAKYLLGITAHDLSNGEDGYVISFGKIRQVNTDTFAAGAILYPSPTVAGVWTDVEPIAPNLDMPIGFCINSSSNNGTIAIRVASGYKLSELHDVAISSPVDRASLYYRGGLWRDTTATLLVSDTAAMLANYATKAYADTSGRFYARQDFTNVSSSTLTWTQSDTLVVGGVNVVQVYRNGQILLPTQYTIPTNASVVIGATAYKVGENYTVIFPRGGGGGSGSGSGSLTSISGGTGILVSPDPITTTGTVSADLSVLMELTDTSLLNLTSRFAGKLNPSDTISLSNRINTKGSGTVTSIATGYGLSGGTITTTGTLLLDSSAVFTKIRDSIVDVAIGNDTIKILKQEYAPALTSILTWTITPKFPIQLKAYILVFRNGQLLNNDQYNLTDTNKITIVSTSFKIGANYTVATVSGIGSIGTGVFPNPVYPEAGIALSTGSAWASSITNNSSNWNTAFSDRLKWDGGSTGLTASTARSSLGGTTIGQSMFTLSNPSSITFPRFNANNSVSSLTASEFRTAIGAGVGTVTSVTVASGTPLSINNNNTVPEISMAAASSSVNGYLSSTDWTTFNGKQNALGFTPANNTININTSLPLQGGGNLTGDRTISILSASQTQSGIVTTSSQLFGGSKVFKNRVTIDSVFTLNTTSSIPTQILGINTTGNVNSVGKFTLGNGLNITLGGTLQADTTFLFTQSDTNQLNLTNRFNLKANLNSPTFTGTVSGINKSMVGLGNVDNTSDANKPISSATQTALNLKFNTADTTSLNLTSRFSAKQNTLNGTGFVKASGTNITYDNSSYLRTGLADSSYLKLTGGTLTGALNGTTAGFNTKLNIGGIDGSTGSPILTAGLSGTPTEIHYYQGTGYEGSSVTLRLTNNNGSFYQNGLYFKTIMERGLDEYNGRIGIMGSDYLTFTKNSRIGLFNSTPNYTFDITGTLGVTGAATLLSTLAVTGDITEGGNNVLTNLDTVSLSNRINGKVGLTGNETISGDKTFTNKIILNDSSRFESNVLFKKNFGLPIVKISNANYTATTANHTIIYTTLTSDKTLTIPNASDAVGIKYTISIFDTPEGNEALTIVTPSNNSFVITDGEGASVDIVGGYCTILQSDGIKWYVLSYSPMY